MIFKEGEKVEVMNGQEAPVSWLSAEILSSCCHTCTVQYEFYNFGTDEQAVECVSKDSIRPCPPLAPKIETLDAGDVVEVFHEYSWKLAAVMKNMGVQRRNKGYKRATTSRYLVRLLGSSLQLIVPVSNIRMRRTWHNGGWLLMEKNFRAANFQTASNMQNLDHYQQMKFLQMQIGSETKKLPTKGYASIYNDSSRRAPTEISLRSRKRMSPFRPSTLDLKSQPVKKVRIDVDQGLKKKAVPLNPIKL